MKVRHRIILLATNVLVTSVLVTSLLLIAGPCLAAPRGVEPLRARAASVAQATRGLDTAIQQADERQVRYWLSKGANVNDRGGDGQTSLMYAISLLGMFTEPEMYPVIRLLANSGAYLHVRDEDGLTPLLLAAAHDTPRTVRLLLARGARHDVRDNAGRTALMAASHSVGEGEITYASPATVALLLQRGADADARDRQGQTALIWAARLKGREARPGIQSDRDSVEVVKLLLAHGANVNTRSHNGNTALRWARARGHARTINLLRRAGARE